MFCVRTYIRGLDIEWKKKEKLNSIFIIFSFFFCGGARKFVRGKDSSFKKKEKISAEFDGIFFFVVELMVLWFSVKFFVLVDYRTKVKKMKYCREYVNLYSIDNWTSIKSLGKNCNHHFIESTSTPTHQIIHQNFIYRNKSNKLM